MSTTIFTAQPYDAAKARRRRNTIILVVASALILLTLLYVNRYWPEKHRVSQFFSQLEAKNFEAAYGLWMNDPGWKQHPDNYKRYPFRAFYNDWGPGGDWGTVKSFEIVGATKPRPEASGVVVGVRVNQRKKLCSVRVEFKDKSMGFSPDEMVE